MMTPHPRRAWCYALATVLMWSTVASAFKWSLRYFAPAQLLWVASLTSSLFLGLWLGLQGRLAESIRVWRARPGYFFLLGLLNPTLYYLLLFQAYQWLPAQQAQAINYTWAIVLSLLAVPFLQQTLNRFDGVAILLAYAGVLLIATRGQLLDLQFDSPAGVVLALLSTLVWASYWLLNTRHQVDPIISLFLAFCSSLLPTLLACLWLADLRLYAWQGWLGALYVGLFEMGLAFVLWLLALRHARKAAHISNLIFLSPFLSLLLLHRLIGESIESATLYGLSLIISALILQQWPQWRRKNPKRPRTEPNTHRE